MIWANLYVSQLINQTNPRTCLMSSYLLYMILLHALFFIRTSKFWPRLVVLSFCTIWASLALKLFLFPSCQFTLRHCHKTCAALFCSLGVSKGPCKVLQTDATSANNSQHCWVLLANNVASVCMGLKTGEMPYVMTWCVVFFNKNLQLHFHLKPSFNCS